MVAVGQPQGRGAQDFVALQVGGRQQAATRCLVGQQGAGQRAAAGVLRPGAGQRGQRLGQVGDVQPFAGADDAAGGGKDAADAFGVGVERGQQGAGVGLERGQSHAVAGQADGRLQQVGQRQAAVVGGQPAQPGDVARHSHGAAAEVEALRGRAEVDRHGLKVQRLRPRPAHTGHDAEEVVDARQASAGVVELGDAAAAQMDNAGLGDERGEGGGHGGVDGVAAPAQHRRAGGGGLFVSRGNDSGGHDCLLVGRVGNPHSALRKN